MFFLLVCQGFLGGVQLGREILSMKRRFVYDPFFLSTKESLRFSSWSDRNSDQPTLKKGDKLAATMGAFTPFLVDLISVQHRMPTNLSGKRPKRLTNLKLSSRKKSYRSRENRLSKLNKKSGGPKSPHQSRRRHLTKLISHFLFVSQI